MSIAEILEKKGRDVVTVQSGAALSEVFEVLVANDIGAVVVLNDQDKVCGILSERDIIRHIANVGVDALSGSCTSCMTEKVVSATGHETVDEAMSTMTQGRFRHLPVIENGRLKGLISIGDVVKRKIEIAEREADDLKHYISG